MEEIILFVVVVLWPPLLSSVSWEVTQDLQIGTHSSKEEEEEKKESNFFSFFSFSFHRDRHMLHFDILGNHKGYWNESKKLYEKQIHVARTKEIFMEWNIITVNYVNYPLNGLINAYSLVGSLQLFLGPIFLKHQWMEITPSFFPHFVHQIIIIKPNAIW